MAGPANIARAVNMLPGSSDPRPFGAFMFEPPCLAGPFEPQGPSLLRPFSSRSGGKGESRTGIRILRNCRVVAVHHAAGYNEDATYISRQSESEF